MSIRPPHNARRIASFPLDRNVLPGGPTEYILASGERYWCRVTEYSSVEVFVYRPFLARLKDAWDVLWGEPRR